MILHGSAGPEPITFGLVTIMGTLALGLAYVGTRALYDRYRHARA